MATSFAVFHPMSQNTAFEGSIFIETLYSTRYAIIEKLT
jgi:hypothetical protein